VCEAGDQITCVTAEPPTSVTLPVASIMPEMHGIYCWWLRGPIFGFTWSSTLRPAVLESLNRCHGAGRRVTGAPLDDTPSGRSILWVKRKFAGENCGRQSYHGLMSGSHSADHWRREAARARAVAGSMNDPKLKQTMIRIAEAYERLARHMDDMVDKVRERRARRKPPRYDWLLRADTERRFHPCHLAPVVHSDRH
jgi:hypothetical protein